MMKHHELLAAIRTRCHSLTASAQRRIRRLVKVAE